MSWEFAKLEKLIDAAFEFEKVVVVDMPRVTGKSTFVKWFRSHVTSMPVVVHSHGTKSNYWSCQHDVHVHVRGVCGDFIIVDELIGDQKVEALNEWIKSNPESKVLVIGTKPEFIGGMRIVWDPYDHELRSRVEALLGHEVNSELLDPDKRDELDKFVGREMLRRRNFRARVRQQ